MMLDIGFNMRGEIIWNKAASASPRQLGVVGKVQLTQY